MNSQITTYSTKTPTLPHKINSFAVAWLHTTGPEIANDKIIQIGGICLNDNGQRVEKTWLINPDVSLSRVAKLRSGLKNKDLAGSPYFNDIKEQIAEFFSVVDMVFVPSFSNQEDWFRRKVFRDLNIPIFNLFTITQYFLPEIEVYDPSGLCHSVMGKALPAKTLEPILNVSLNILHRISEKVLTDQRPFYKALPMLLDVSEDSTLMMVSRLIKDANKFAFEKNLSIFDSSNVINYDDAHVINATKLLKPLWLKNVIIQRKALPKKPKMESILVSKEYAGDILKSIGKKIDNYTERPLQAEYSAIVSKALNYKDISFIESGTGTGKSLGYILAAMDLIEKNPGKKVLISTATKNLQTQLIEREIPRLSKRYPGIKTAVLKGKGNYLCLSALKRAYRTWFDDSEIFNSDKSEGRAAWIYLVNLVHSLNDGDLEAIPRRIYDWFPILQSMIKETNAATHCKKGSCNPHVDIYGKVKQEASSADIIITNHYKFAVLDKDFIQSVNHFIIDEADQFGRAVRSSLSYHLSHKELHNYLRRLVGGRRRGYLRILQDYIIGVKRKLTNDEKEEALAKVKQVQKNVDVFIQVANQLGEVLFNEFPLWVQKKTLSGKIVKEEYLLKKLDGLKDGKIVREYATIISNLSDTIQANLKEISSNTKLSQSHRGRCRAYALLAEEITGLAKSISEEINSYAVAHSVTLLGKNNWVLSRHQVYIDQYLKDTFYSDGKHIVYTSATMSVFGKFSYFLRNYGVDPNEHRVLLKSIGDILNHEYQAVTYVDYSLAEYNYKDCKIMAKWHQDIQQSIARYTWAVNGRTLVLFTSWNDMKICYERLAPFFHRYDIQPLIQKGASLEEIGEFRRNEYSVLFGVDRFWSGVDFPGGTLSQVIIVKAPNPSLSDPIIQHRILHEPHFLSTDYSMMAKIKLKQGAGRLLRNEQDKGGVIILDSRYRNKPYMAEQLNVLPMLVEMSEDQERIQTHIIKKAGLKDEYSGRGVSAASAVCKYFKGKSEIGFKDILSTSDIYSSELGLTTL